MCEDSQLSSVPPFRGVYINLERSKKRRVFMDAQFHKLKLQDHYQRFPAIDGRTLQRSSSQLRPEEIGCFMSHLQALRTLTYKPGGVHSRRRHAAISLDSARHDQFNRQRRVRMNLISYTPSLLSFQFQKLGFTQTPFASPVVQPEN
jgi:hypothetical protein